MALLKNIRNKMVFYRNKSLDSIKKLKKSEDFHAITNFAGYVSIYGLCLNAFFLLFGFPFTLFSWISFGLGVWVIDNKFIGMLRRLWFR
jgi:hypothetical protein